MAGKSCYNCVYGFCDPEVWLRDAYLGNSLVVQCANHPWWPGRMHDVPGVACRHYRPKPKLPGGDAVRLIPLGDGFYAYVDAADYEWLSQWNWHMVSTGYAARNEKGRTILMHRQIMQPPKGMVVDHADANKANNCRFNLRVCTRRENQRNKRKENGALSRFKGVFYDKRYDKWYARCRYEGKYRGLGYYDNEVEAARAYDLAAVKWFGEFARLNFPEEWPPQRRARAQSEWEEFEKRRRRKRKPKDPGPRTEDKRRKTAGRERAKGKSKKAKGNASKRKTQDARRITKSRRATGHASRPTASKRPKRKTQHARRPTKEAGGRGP